MHMTNKSTTIIHVHFNFVDCSHDNNLWRYPFDLIFYIVYRENACQYLKK